jgi:hypothetical protein
MDFVCQGNVEIAEVRVGNVNGQFLLVRTCIHTQVALPFLPRTTETLLGRFESAVYPRKFVLPFTYSSRLQLSFGGATVTRVYRAKKVPALEVEINYVSNSLTFYRNLLTPLPSIILHSTSDFECNEVIRVGLIVVVFF